MPTVEELNVKVSADTKQFEQGMNKVNDQLKDTTKGTGNASNGFSSMIATALGIDAITNIVGKVVDGLGKIAEVTKDVMEATNKQVLAEVKMDTIMRQRMGTNNEVLQGLKNYASELQQVGVVGDEVALSGVAQLSSFLNSEKALKTLTPVMEDLATATNGINIDSGTMFGIANQIGKAMANNSLSALTRSGITVTDEELARFKALTSEEDKAQLLANIITQNVGHMNQALANTYSGRVTQLKNNFGDLKEILGQMLQDTLYPIVYVLNLAVSNVVQFLKFIGLGVGTTNDVKGNLTSVADKVTKTSNAMEDTANASKQITKNAKATVGAFKGLSGIDEINTLSKVNENIGANNVSTAPTVSNVTADVDVSDSSMSTVKGKIGKWLEEMKTTITNSSAWQTLKGIGETIYEAIEPYLPDIKKGFKDMVDGIADIFKGLWKIVTSIVGGIVGVIGGFLTGDTQKVYDSVSDAVKGVKEGMKQVGDGVTEFNEGWFEVETGVIGATNNVGSTLVGNVVKVSKQMVTDGITAIKSKLGETKVGKWILDRIEGAKDLVATLTTNIKDGASTMRTKIVTAWNTVKTKTATLSAKMSDVNATLRTKLQNAWGKIKTKTATLKTYFSDKTSSMRTKLTNAWEMFKTKTATISVAFKDLFSSAFKKVWNTLANAINGAIGVINKIPGVNITARVPIMQLATGGIATSSTFAEIGENGREAVLPLERNTGWMDTLADRLASNINANSNAQPMEIEINIGGTKFGKVCIDSINKAQKKNGAILLNI